MTSKTLAVIYRPKTFDDVVEQNTIKEILQHQIETDSVKNAYLFCGGAGTGKTTVARIFANEINNGHGLPIEMDAASNNGVDDVRQIIQNAQMQSLTSEYKVIIVDEAHGISNSGWQAFLKLIEEPPAKTIFIFCTTDPQKIPETIISRVQRFDFNRISQKSIIDRLLYICMSEELESTVKQDALEYISKIADGGMRDAISLMEKALAYSEDLTVENVVEALGVVDYDLMIKLTSAILKGRNDRVIKYIETVHNAGKDLKQFVKMYSQFLLDVCKYGMGCGWEHLQLPSTDTVKKALKKYTKTEERKQIINVLMKTVIKLNGEIKWSTMPKHDVEASLLLFMMENNL